jgi:hypothetical protein
MLPMHARPRGRHRCIAALRVNKPRIAWAYSGMDKVQSAVRITRQAVPAVRRDQGIQGSFQAATTLNSVGRWGQVHSSRYGRKWGRNRSWLYILNSCQPAFQNHPIPGRIIAHIVVIIPRIMATVKTPEAVAQENAAIQEALEEVTAASKAYAQVSSANAGKAGLIEAGKVTESKLSLHLKAQRLLQAVRGPVDLVTSHQENVRSLLATVRYRMLEN